MIQTGHGAVYSLLFGLKSLLKLKIWNIASKRKMMSNNILVIGVAGGTGSGKTTIATGLLNRLKELRISTEIIMMDSYYRNLSNLSFDERAKTNFDHPASLEIDLLVQHVKELKNGIGIDVPIYDFEQHQRKHQVTRLDPPTVLILEGILLFVDQKLRDLIDIKVFVEASADVRFIRRLKRDVVERGRSVDQICSQYLETVRKMHEEFVEPSKIHADLIVPNVEPDDPDVLLDLLTSRALSNGLSHPNKRLKG